MGILGTSNDQVIDDLIHARLQHFRKTPYGRENDLPFFVADTTKVIEQHQRWTRALPNIHPFYAVKCNPDPKLLKLLGSMGANFDCASLAEIEQVLGMGIDPSRIVFAHPCKAPSALKVAERCGVRWTTFDNADELDKIGEVSPRIELLLRIYAQDDSARIGLGSKFGAPMEHTQELLEKARRLGLNIVGVSFHIGSGASDPNAFVTAVQHAKRVFEDGQALGFNMHMLDVGGGFEDTSFETMAYPLREAVAREFSSEVTVIAEPGRFYASGFYTMVCQVIARRTRVGAKTTNHLDMLYLNDGLYGCFSMVWSEGGIFIPTLVEPQGKISFVPRERGPHRYSIWGPTCDSVDRISEEVVMDREVKVGDWLKFRDMGAYTTSIATQFNGFPNNYAVIYHE